MRWRGRSPPSGESTLSLKLCTQSRQHFVNRRFGGKPRCDFGIPARRDGVPRGISCAVGIQACDDTIKQSDSICRRQSQHFIFEGFER